VIYRLVDLRRINRRLTWDSHIPAAKAVFDQQGFEPPYRIRLSCEDVPNFGSDETILTIDPEGIADSAVEMIRRTFDVPTLVEMAAIAIAGVVLFHAGGHRITDIAFNPDRADYQVDDEETLLEVAGRSNRRNFRGAWNARWDRLREAEGSGFYLSVTEFQTPATRLAFAIEDVIS
jgi:hypothetical protein